MVKRSAGMLVRVLLIFAVLFVATSTRSQEWEPVGAESFEAIAAVEDGGLLIKTTNAGNSWQAISGLPFVNFESPEMFTPDSFLVFNRSNGPVFTISQNGSNIDSSALLFNPQVTDSGFNYINTIDWIGNSGEGIGFGAHVNESQIGTDSAECHFMITSDAGRSWTTTLNRETKLWRGILASAALPNGTAVAGGTIRDWMLWTNNWRDNEWYEDSISAPPGSSEISNISLLDSEHALLNMDDGTAGGGIAVGWIVRVILNTPASVANDGATKSSFQVYPNPAKTTLTIGAHIGPVTIVDPLGRNYEVKQIGSTLDISTLPSGVYFVSDGVNRAKFVKE